jgi:ubiquinone/menaquinone biosynthesis C-methylase UbiE
VNEEVNLNDEVRSAWDQLAGYWDERTEAGATWQQRLIQPSVERLLRLQPGERVLEIACGNGQFARRMAELGAQVLATDFSERMLERARAHGGDVEYRLADATDEEVLLALGPRASFDAIVSNAGTIAAGSARSRSEALGAETAPATNLMGWGYFLLFVTVVGSDSR